MIHTAPSFGRSPTRRRTGATLAAWVVAGLLALAAACVITMLWPRWPGSSGAPDAPTVPVTVAGVLFNVPPLAIRITLERQPGAHDRLDLVFLWPSLEPPDPAAKLPISDEQLPTDRLFVTIVPADGALAPYERMTQIYPRYLGDGPYKGPDGLAVSLFRDGTPYAGEDLFFDTTAPEKFIARCTRPRGGPTPGTCLTERRVGTADVTTRFPRHWLADWRMLSAAIDRLIGQMHPAR
jgi:hypothetical protein